MSTTREGVAAGVRSLRARAAVFEGARPLTEGGSAGRTLAAERVLVVEDDRQIRSVVRRMLERAGAEVTTADTAFDALTALAREGACFDLLLSDLGLPGMSGFELVARLDAEARRDGRGHLPACAMSGLVDDSVEQRALAAGFDAFVGKPFTTSELLAALDPLCARRRGDDAPGA